MSAPTVVLLVALVLVLAGACATGMGELRVAGWLLIAGFGTAGVAIVLAVTL